MITVSKLSVAYGDFQLRDVDLELREGGCLAVLGPSGAGKTLLLETVMGSRKPDSGTVHLNDKDISSLPPEHRNIAYIPQDLALFPHLSVRENIAFGLKARNLKQSIVSDIERIAKVLGIEHLLSRKDIRTLSGGEKQRVALARALVVNPRVLFLDEPLSALDVAASRELLHALRKMRRELNPTMFLVSHDLTEVCFLADEVAIMIDGRIAEKGPLQSVVSCPKSLASARFLNMRNVVAVADVAEFLPELAKSAPSGSTYLAVRPESITVSTNIDSESFIGTVADIVTLHSNALLMLALPRFTLEASIDLEQSSSLSLGQNVSIHLNGSKILWLQE
ncbi:MAG: ATP-binding cassette domain-containing protein [Fimbriimonadales bacterium]|nr:ATP-binding cassette domain-containing protein [Fimbriimonadales bacterium]